MRLSTSPNSASSSAATAISVIESSADDDDDDWYTLQGLKIGRRPTQQGIYIHKGKTVTIKWRK